MKKNILGGCVIFVITIAILLMIDNFAKHRSPDYDTKVDKMEAIKKQELATNDLKK